MADIFLSYSRKDSAFRDRLLTDLKTEGIEVWIDEQELTFGDPTWPIAIEKAIEEAVCTLVLLSPNSKSSVEVRKEISYSEKQEKRVVPVLIAGDQKTVIPSNLIEAHYVDLRTNYQENFQRLAEVVKKLVSDSINTRVETILGAKPWILGNDPTGADMFEHIFNASAAKTDEASDQVPTTDRSLLRAEIISIFTSFYSSLLDSEKAKIGTVEVSLTKTGIF